MEKTSAMKKLHIVKLTHTIIWFVFVVAILYVCYAGAFNKVNGLVWWCIGAIVFEGIVLLANNWRCPLTLVAHKYTENHSAGFDIYLPAWLAKHNKPIFTSLFFIGLALVIWRIV